PPPPCCSPRRHGAVVGRWPPPPPIFPCRPWNPSRPFGKLKPTLWPRPCPGLAPVRRPCERSTQGTPTMPWPLSQDYNEAVQNPRLCFADDQLRAGQVVTNALGLPMPHSGNFADVYEVRSPATGSRWAVKCFTRQVPGLGARYPAVSAHLRQARLPFAVEFQYLEQGIRVLGQWYPALKMDWVEGLLLNEFVRQHLDRPPMLQALADL